MVVDIFFVYVDRTTDGRPFYVGKGKSRRVKMNERNAYWRNIAAKHGQQREVVLATRDEAFAFEQEKRLIIELGTFEDGTPGRWGANLTEGGEGPSGVIRNEAYRQRVSERFKGRLRSEESRKRQSESIRGEKNHLYGRTGLAHPKTGKTMSLETRQRQSDALRGRDSWNRGKTGVYTEEANRRRAEAVRAYHARRRAIKAHGG